MASLFDKVVSSGKWVGGLRIVKKSSSIVKNVVLARLLAPEDFGLFGIALLVLTGFHQLTVVGIHTAVVQAEEVDEEYLDTAFWLRVLRGLLVAVGGFLLAPWAAEFFDEPKAAPLARVLALGPLVLGFKNIGIALLQKKLDFRRYSIFQTSFVVAEVGSSIVLAVILRSAWALVYGHLIGKCTRTILSYVFHSYRPGLKVDWVRVDKIADFGVWILLSSVTGFASLKLDDILLGRWSDAEALGHYQLAFMVGNILALQVANIVHKVMFPAFSELQNDTERLRSVYDRTLQFVGILIVPSGIGLAFVSRQFVYVVFGEKWMSMTAMVSILSISGIFRALSQIQNSLFVGIGKPNLKFYGTTFRLAVLVVAVYPAFLYFGEDGIAVAAAVSTFSAVVVYYLLARRLLGLDLTAIRRMLPSIIASAAMLIALLGIDSVVSFSPTVELWLSVGTGIVVFGIVFVPVDWLLGYQTLAMLWGLGSRALFGTKDIKE